MLSLQGQFFAGAVGEQRGTGAFQIVKIKFVQR